MASLEEIKKLRELTGVGVADALQILQEANGDLERASDLVRKKGLAAAEKKSSRAARSGLVHAYVHGGKVGVLVEVNCETDFVAKTADFKDFVHDVALQAAAMQPRYISRGDVPDAVERAEREILREQISGSGKTGEIQDRVIEGKLEKFFEEVCLLEQYSVKDPKIKMGQLLANLVSKVGENIVIARFVRYQLGEK
ncbi:MAG: elongation factor Ts [Candidatus Doudnabacteria bacterium]|nr:elongation factor Ts [Candidatus Doudnabacteria bacterium]